MESDTIAYEVAERNFVAASAAYDKSVQGGGDENVLKALARQVPPGLYEHFKSKEDDPKFYAVHGVFFDTDGRLDYKVPPVVCYAPLYSSPLAARPPLRKLLDHQEGFLKPVQRPSYTGPRFKLIHSLATMHLGQVLGSAHVFAQIKSRSELLSAINKTLGR